MKTKIYALILAFGLSFATNTSIVARELPTDEPAKKLTDEAIAKRMEEMRERVEEIKSLDRSKLTKKERKALRQELREMNKEAKELGQRGIYISFGAIIIIILLLILIL